MLNQLSKAVLFAGFPGKTRRQLFINALSLSAGLEVVHMETVVPTVKKAKPVNVLIPACNFDYEKELLTVQFRSQANFRVKSCSAYFVASSKFFKNQQALSFVTSEEADHVFQMTHGFSNIPIDFFGFSKDRSFVINIAYALENLYLSAKFVIALPALNLAELHFKPPGTTYPDESTRRICQQAFQMDETNSEQEIIACIHLEEFKNLPIVDRYRAFGYVHMQETFLNIENSFELDLLLKFNKSVSKVEKLSAIHYRIDVRCQISA